MSYQIKSMNQFHQDLLLFLRVHIGPGAQTAASRHFNVTQGWISQVVNSDAFRAAYQDRFDESFDNVMAPIEDKLKAVADVALDRLHEKAYIEQDSNTLVNIADKMLKSLGYGANSQGSGTVVNNTVVVENNAAFQQAREILHNKGDTINAKVQLPSSERVHSVQADNIRQANTTPTRIPAALETDGSEATGKSVRGESTQAIVEALQV